jgi:dipeptidyl aminopeptidase/acylaminoacyl peptidase
MRVLPVLLALVLLATQAHAQAPRAMRVFVSVALSPDGASIASIEGDAPPGGGSPSLYQLVLRQADGGGQRVIPMPCGEVARCTPFDPVWESDGRHIVFILRLPGDGFVHAIERLDVASGILEQLTTFDGPVSTLRFAADGTLAMLVTPDATKDIGATAPGAQVVGDLDAAPAEQRIAILRDGKAALVSPPDLYVYEYAWRPDGSGFVGTAAPGDGDQNWWSAKLYAFDAAAGGAARVIYTPSSPQQQLTLPIVSPDGRQVAFIGGLMSDFDAVSGDAFVMPLDDPHPVARDVTQGWTVSVVSLGWGCQNGTLRAGLQAGSETQMVTLADTPSAAPLSIDYSAEEQLQGGDEFVSVACKPGIAATIRQGYAAPPEIAVGPMQHWRNITSLNDGVMPPAASKTLPIAWQHDGFRQQGWLLLPHQQPAAGVPMVTIVHGGPGAAHIPYFIGPGLFRDMLGAGYALFLPNPRGSFGQGLAFTTAIVRNMGHGVLGDILAGIDAAEQAAPIDDHRLGIGGWSYGGYMAMFAGTQTDRFRAAYAGAGISDWQSYYGQTGIDGWMPPFFGASVYDDPEIYARASPITYIRQARVPTFLAVGQRDIECPPPQTIEMWRALRYFGVPTNAVVYAGEGHNFRDPVHIADLNRRIIGWFDTYLPPKPP